MAVSHVEVIVEEPSMEAALRVLLPRLLGNVTFQIYRHQGKHDLLKRLPGRLQGYASWLPDSHRIVIVVDRDNDDCHQLKRKLETMATQAGLQTRTTASQGAYQVVSRLAIEELEAWYFGDWQAVCAAFPKAPETIPQQAKYRDPDTIDGGTWEAFERVMQRAGYFYGGLGKIEAARAIAEHWDPDANQSHSFRALRDVFREMAGT